MARCRYALLGLLVLFLSCLCDFRPAAAASIVAEDPLENVDRAVFAFDEARSPM